MMNRNTVIIEADELRAIIDNPNLRIFDATITDDVYLQEHILGAAFFDHERFSDPNSPYSITILPVDELVAQIGRVGISNDSEVVLYACGMLPYAVRAWWVLRYAGHDNVRVLNGGLSAWKNAGGTVEQEARRYEPTMFKGHFRPEMFVDKHEVLQAMEDESVNIVNVMPPESFEGKHIVGSTNLSCMDLMQGMDYLLPNDKLAARLREATHYDRIITYCGGGIAAAVNAMAHMMTGHKNVAVYDGSLYEWLGEGLPADGNGKWEIWQQPQ